MTLASDKFIREQQADSGYPVCHCKSTEFDVVDSRPGPVGQRRRRKCRGCGNVVTTVEVVVRNVGPGHSVSAGLQQQLGCALADMLEQQVLPRLRNGSGTSGATGITDELEDVPR